MNHLPPEWLLYCLFLPRWQIIPPPVLLGLYEQPLQSLGNDSLTAVFAKYPEPKQAPTVALLTHYERVIAAYHATRTVIPMRFGCRFSDQAAIRRFVETHSEPFRLRLEQLEGMIEMGVRAYLPQVEREQPLPTTAAAPPEGRPGRAFLQARQHQYAQEMRIDPESVAFLGRCRTALGGVCAAMHWDQPSPEKNGVASHLVFPVHFLMEKFRVESFRKDFELFNRQEAVQLFLTGPWAPYNFIEPTAQGSNNGDSNKDNRFIKFGRGD